MFAVDTNVVASLLLKGPFTEPARALYAADPDWRSEAFLMTELANVLATQIRLRGMPLPDALGLLARCDALMAEGLFEVRHEDALTLAAHFGVSAYDSRHLVLAQRLRTRLVTEDARLRQKAPELTCSLAEALTRAG